MFSGILWILRSSWCDHFEKQSDSWILKAHSGSLARQDTRIPVVYSANLRTVNRAGKRTWGRGIKWFPWRKGMISPQHILLGVGVRRWLSGQLGPHLSPRGPHTCASLSLLGLLWQSTTGWGLQQQQFISHSLEGGCSRSRAQQGWLLLRPPFRDGPQLSPPCVLTPSSLCACLCSNFLFLNGH